MLLQLIVYPF